jgi:hypothetical protein
MEGDQDDTVSLADLARYTSHQSPGPLTADALYAFLPISSQPRTIRLLDVDGLPAWRSGTLDHIPLTGTLRVVSLSTCPDFAALSYVWGRPSSPPDVISCGDYDIEITTNCRDALRQLRRRYGSVTVWVDAICINQKDAREKSSQIPLMEEIYTWARQVYVWLGSGNEKSNRAMKYLSTKSPNTTNMCLAGVTWTSAFDWVERRRAMVKYKLQAFLVYYRILHQRNLQRSKSTYLLCDHIGDKRPSCSKICR